jgi:predicted MFS family arabinose efflux permease
LDLLFIMSASSMPVESANFRHLVYDIAWFGLAWPATERFLQTYAIHLGAGVTELNQMKWITSFVMLFACTIAVRWMQRFSDSRKATFLPAIGHRLIFLLPALTPFLPAHLQTTWLMLSVALPALPQGIAAVSFVVMYREAVHDDKIAALSSRRMLFFNLTIAASGLAMGFLLKSVMFPFNYQIMYILAFGAALMSVWHLNRVRPVVNVSAPRVSNRPVRNPWFSPGFQTIAVIVMVTMLSFNSNASVITLHLTEHLNADEWFISLFGLAELAAGATAAYFMQPLIQRYGNRPLIGVLMMGTGLSTLIIALAHNLPVTLVAAAIGGGCWTAFNITLFTYFNEMTVDEDRVAASTAYHQAVFLAAILGPLFSEWLNGQGASVVSILLIGTMLRFGAGVVTQLHPRVWMERALHLAPR